MSHRVFIDGQAGTTGLGIHALLAGRPDVELLEIDPDRRKDAAARRACLNDADVVVLCLPDAAAREAVALIEAPGVRVLDASTAHRTAPDWVFGLPELAVGQRDAIRGAPRVANPGCYSTGFILAVRPLVDAGLLEPERTVTVHGLSGHSGGGRAMIDRYAEAARAGVAGVVPARLYGLGLDHKHRPEMQRYGGLARAPLFLPTVAPHYKGMLVSVPLPRDLLTRTVGAEELVALLAEHYAGERCVEVIRPDGRAALEDGFLDPEACNDTNRVELLVFGDAPDLLLVARLDNLGKGAGGAAVQNLNLMLGADEFAGLTC